MEGEMAGLMTIKPGSPAGRFAVVEDRKGGGEGRGGGRGS